MSHFTVLVIGDDFEKQLAPYHEFECTGEDDEFVQDVDITEDARREVGAFYDSEAAAGLKASSFEERAAEYYGYEIARERGGVVLAGAHKFGYILVEQQPFGPPSVRVIRRTNPRRKWDWYAVGGRWTGYFKLRDGAEGATGEPGLMTEPAKAGYADQCRKRDVDIEAMRAEAAENAGQHWDEIHAIIDPHPPITPWKQMQARYAVQDSAPASFAEASAAYREQPAIEALNNSQLFVWEPEEFLVPRQEYVERAVRATLVPFAVVKDGQWFECGEMGWWGVVSDEKDSDQWNAEFSKLFGALPDDTLLTLVDCHI